MSNANLLEKEFLDQINDLIEKNISNDKFGVSKLAQEMGMSRSNLHRKIHSIAKVSVSRFIRNVRLEKAKELLRDSTLTVSEVAYNVGFSNPSYFSKCFHDVFGYPPGELGKVEETELAMHSSIKSPKNRIIVFSSVVVAFVLIFFVFNFIKKDDFKGVKALFGSKKMELSRSIAVLPFIALGGEEENEIFAEGVTGSILNKLIQINDFKVVAINRPKQVLEGVLNLEEIANEFETSFLLEGSVQYNEDRVKVLVNLFDAENKQLIWSDEYNSKLVDIFVIQSDIAKQVASKLEAVISPQEREIIDIIPTRNAEAHSNYLKGRYFLNKREGEAIEKSKDYFNRAIAADSSFADAYAGMADAYLVSTLYQHYARPDGYIKAKAFALRALELDNNLAEAHASLGAVLCFVEWKWEEARKEFEIAIKQNPNSSTAHHYYARLLYILQELEESRIHLNRAMTLNPTSIQILQTSISTYCREQKLTEALDECKKMEELDPGGYSAHWHYFHIYNLMGDELKAVAAVKKALSIMPEDLKYANIIDHIYRQSGMVGVMNMLIDYETIDIEQGIVGLARLYSYLGEKEKAIDCLYIAMDLDIPFFTTFLGNEDMVHLHNDPEFKAIIEWLGLSTYYDYY